jgi:tetratricopeptide (TPR) repeat protein
VLSGIPASLQDQLGRFSLRTATGVYVLGDRIRHGGVFSRAWLCSARIAVCLATLSLTACATAPGPAPNTKTAAELMNEAQAATAAGDKQKAREAYRVATQADPTAKAPWIKLAESYFESADYGHAVLAAEEALHRDANDPTAAGIMAVSGLRISTSALSKLRGQSGISEGTRGEAETLARTLRELLGEPVLVPKPAESAVAAPTRATRAKPNTAAAPRPSEAVPAPATKRVSRPAPAAANPFDTLK